jgi:hypothetical protein
MLNNQRHKICWKELNMAAIIAFPGPPVMRLTEEYTQNGAQDHCIAAYCLLSKSSHLLKKDVRNSNVQGHWKLIKQIGQLAKQARELAFEARPDVLRVDALLQKVREVRNSVSTQRNEFGADSAKITYLE